MSLTQQPKIFYLMQCKVFCFVYKLISQSYLAHLYKHKQAKKKKNKPHSLKTFKRFRNLGLGNIKVKLCWPFQKHIPHFLRGGGESEVTSQIQLDLANWFDPTESPFLQEIYNQLQFSLPRSDIYRVLRELQTKPKGRCQPYELGTVPVPAGSSPLSRILWGYVQGCCSRVQTCFYANPVAGPGLK